MVDIPLVDKPPFYGLVSLKLAGVPLLRQMSKDISCSLYFSFRLGPEDYLTFFALMSLRMVSTIIHSWSDCHSYQFIRATLYPFSVCVPVTTRTTHIVITPIPHICKALFGGPSFISVFTAEKKLIVLLNQLNKTSLVPRRIVLEHDQTWSTKTSEEEAEGSRGRMAGKKSKYKKKSRNKSQKKSQKNSQKKS
jgi:hypothetical protein